MISVICFPLSSKGTIYFDVINNALQEKGKIEIVSLNEAIRSLSILKKSEVAFFSLYEDVKSSNIVYAYIKALIKMLTIIYLKAFKIKIVYTIHNGKHHDKRYQKVTSILTRYMIASSDSVIYLCDETLNVLNDYLSLNKVKNKLLKIPHPNYVGVYPNLVTSDYRGKWGIEKDEILFLFLGQIRPYKNIELVIKLAKEFTDNRVKFVIAGAPNDSSYFDELKEQANGLKNIYFTGEFVKNEDIANYVTACDVMILPYDKTSLNSGPVFIGPSFKRNVIVPEIGSALEYPQGLLYTYNYVSEADHYEKLKETMKFAIDEDQNHHEVFLKKQEALYDFLIGYNSGDILKKKYHDLLFSLIDKGEA